ncbi:MAG: hypothetical protein WCO23_00030 [bacterium]
MKIGVDLDDVLGEFMPRMLAFHNEKYGTKFGNRDVGHVHALFELISDTEEEAIAKMELFYKSDYFSDLPPVKGAKENLRKIKDAGHKLVCITGRPSHLKDLTVGWIKEHFEDIIEEVHFADSVVHAHGWSKGEMCKRLGIHHHIDDFLAFAQNCAENGISVFLLDRPWNRNVELDINIKRVFSWDEISLDLIKLNRLERNYD